VALPDDAPKPTRDLVPTVSFGILALVLVAAVLASAGVFKSATAPYREPDIRTVSGTPLTTAEVNQLVDSFGLEGRLIRENLPHGFTRTASFATASGSFEVISATNTPRDLGFYLTEGRLLRAIGLLEELAEHQPITSEELQQPPEKIMLRLATNRYSQHVLMFPGWLGNFDSWSSAGPKPGKIERGAFGEWINQDVRKENAEFRRGQELFSRQSFEYEALDPEEGFRSTYEPEDEVEEEPTEQLLSARNFYGLLCQVALQEEPASPATEQLRNVKPLIAFEGNELQEVSSDSLEELCTTQGMAIASAASPTPISYQQYVENARSQYTPPSAAGLVSPADYERYTDRLEP